MKPETHKYDAAFPPSGLRAGMTKREYLVFQIYKESVSKFLNSATPVNNVDTFQAYAQNSIIAADILFTELNKS